MFLDFFNACRKLRLCRAATGARSETAEGKRGRIVAEQLQPLGRKASPLFSSRMLPSLPSPLLRRLLFNQNPEIPAGNQHPAPMKHHPVRNAVSKLETPARDRTRPFRIPEVVCTDEPVAAVGEDNSVFPVPRGNTLRNLSCSSEISKETRASASGSSVTRRIPLSSFAGRTMLAATSWIYI